jgi:hypothetical protein
LELAFTLLHKHFGVPKLLDPEDVLQYGFDEIATVVYVSTCLAALAEGETADDRENTTSESKLKYASSTDLTCAATPHTKPTISQAPPGHVAEELHEGGAD